MDKNIIIVTGCLGFMGSNLTKTLLDLNQYVIGIDKCTYAANLDRLEEFKKYSNFEFHHKDINDIQFLPECDYIINTASETHVANSIIDDKEFIHSNINGVHNILRLIKNYRAESTSPILIQYSTDECYGDLENGSFTENANMNPSNPYAASKCSADLLIKAWGRTHGIKYMIARMTNNYGIHQSSEKLIPRVIKCLCLNKKIPLHNNGDPIRNWLNVNDTSLAIIKLIESGKIGEIYNVSGSYEKTNKEIVYFILKEYLNNDNFRIEDYVDFSYNRKGQDIRYSLDDSKLKVLGWAPKHQLYKELPQIIKYYKQKFTW